MIILLSIFFAIARMTTLALNCTSCDSRLDWTDCLQRSTVQICNNETASGHILGQYSSTTSSHPTLGCFQLHSKNIRTGAKRFQQGCTNHADFCSILNPNYLTVEQCSLCPKGDPDVYCHKSKNKNTLMDFDLFFDKKFGKLTATKSTTLENQNEETTLSLETTPAQQTSTMTTEILTEQERRTTTFPSQPPTEGLSRATMPTITTPAATTTTYPKTQTPESNFVTILTQPSSPENNSLNITPRATLLVVAVTGITFIRNWCR
ncbi:uncharacterized protein LOC129776433 [Toxorhynchites rutilus septentrionalis]|uniref:uncharacterized protein LOC129776433 n=1 Tax=Toxorhynchites rutilus septentrionalis TaxID=329112 RepID=UPI002478DA8D|nr:uncharacterized protein LOC129776433 [Toxorhynchites rutilus septentrionalis]XP_055638057.1 uncharacterized protein LOC129776433 [Toxorhynchites rutilus septentrionalis]